MKTYNYYDPQNAYPYASLVWEGAGYYAGVTNSRDSMAIHKIADLDYDGRWPKAPEGYGTVKLCSTPEEAAGYYAPYPAR